MFYECQLASSLIIRRQLSNNLDEFWIVQLHLQQVIQTGLNDSVHFYHEGPIVVILKLRNGD